MLLMGMWMSFTKKPMKPMMANPMAVAKAIFWNSEKKSLCKSLLTANTIMVKWLNNQTHIVKYRVWHLYSHTVSEKKKTFDSKAVINVRVSINASWIVSSYYNFKILTSEMEHEKAVVLTVWFTIADCTHVSSMFRLRHLTYIVDLQNVGHNKLPSVADMHVHGSKLGICDLSGSKKKPQARKGLIIITILLYL